MSKREPQTNQNSIGVMSRLRESRLTLAAATVGSFVAMELGTRTHQAGGASQPEIHASHVKTGIRPGAVMNSIVKIHDQNDWNETRIEDFVNLRSASISYRGYNLKGSCQKKSNGLEPYTKSIFIHGDQETRTNCENNKKDTFGVDRDRPDGFYGQQTNRISKKMARSVRIPSQIVGPGVEVKANRSVAVAKFRKLPIESNATSSINRSLKKLIIRKYKKPTKIFYKMTH